MQTLDLPDKAVTVELPPGTHKWTYRGQITQKNREVTVKTHIKEIHREETSFVITADGILSADGLVIYQMEEFSLKLTAVSRTTGSGAENQAVTTISE